MTLHVAPVGYEAARYAVMHWHYSRAWPTGRLIKVGAWEDGRYIGAVIYGRGATPHLAGSWGLQQTECVELVRVALTTHTAPVSEIVAASLRYLRATNPGLRLVVSFADPDQGHHGGIYQAGNWTYTGAMDPARYFRVNGRVMHPKSVYDSGWRQSLPWLREHVDPNAEGVVKPGKHRYVMPLDKAMRRVVQRRALPYPAPLRSPGGPGIDGETTTPRVVGAGSTPADRST